MSQTGLSGPPEGLLARARVKANASAKEMDDGLNTLQVRYRKKKKQLELMKNRLEEIDVDEVRYRYMALKRELDSVDRKVKRVRTTHPLLCCVEVGSLLIGGWFGSTGGAVERTHEAIRARP